MQLNTVWYIKEKGSNFRMKGVSYSWSLALHLHPNIYRSITSPREYGFAIEPKIKGLGMKCELKSNSDKAVQSKNAANGSSAPCFAKFQYVYTQS